MIPPPTPLLAFLHALVCLTVVIHPIGFALATPADSPRDAMARWRQTLRACLAGGAALMALAVTARATCALLGLGLAPVRVGCAVLMALATADLTMRRPGPRAGPAQGAASPTSMALALIEGPGTPAVAVLVAARAGSDPALILAVLAALAVVLAGVLLAVRQARYLTRRLGLPGATAMGRAMAVPLAVLAAQELVSGLRDMLAAP